MTAIAAATPMNMTVTWDYDAGFCAATSKAAQLLASSVALPPPVPPRSAMVEAAMALLGIGEAERTQAYEAVVRRQALAFSPDDSDDLLSNEEWAQGWHDGAAHAISLASPSTTPNLMPAKASGMKLIFH